MEKNNYLPDAFQKAMRDLLKNEYEEFVSAYDKERHAGLRRNPLKSAREHFEKVLPFDVSQVSWAEEGYYYSLSERPGKHPLHEAGAYYIQEPSAMSAVAVLDPVPGDIVLDLCAAPGGKSTQIAGRLMGEGLLVSNEYVKDRASVLSQNIERMGVTNAIVLNEAPERLSEVFPSFFDKILVDAPCSGEGMFRKEELAASEWSPEHVKMCAERQSYILEESAKMLKAGGVLVYSTCTFNPHENEETVSAFIAAHPEFEIEASPVAKFFSPARPEWCPTPTDGLEKAMRLWPHKLDGEGHFVVRLKKKGELIKQIPSPTLTGSQAKLLKEIKTFLSNEFCISDEKINTLIKGKIPFAYGDNIYLMPLSNERLKGLRVVRPGLHVCVQKKNRFEPAHSLAIALTPSDCASVFEASFDEAVKYLHGETINCPESLKGWTIVCHNGFSMGLAKATGGILKNHYPKGLRIM